jgi:hypothetical protein
MPPTRLWVSHQQVIIAAIRLPSHMRQISNEWYCAQRILHRQVEEHANQRDTGGAALPCGENDKQRGKRSNRVAYSWDPTDQSVQSKANAGSRNNESIVQPGRDYVEMFI